MKLSRFIAFVLCLSLSIISTAGFAQQKPQEQTSVGKAAKSSKIVVIGQIQYLKSQGGYFVRGDHPFGIFKIANQNPDLLKKLLKSGDKHLNIEGRLTNGTNLLSIEKINGQVYTCAKKPATK
jgi:predicted ferric reductase